MNEGQPHEVASWAIAGIILAAIAGVPRAAHATGLEPFGLQGETVTSLGFHGSLYAGTIDAGVFRRGLADSTWTPLGLEGKRIRTVYPHKFGPLGFATSVGIELHPGDPDSVLVYCAEFDQPPWTATDSGMTRGVVSVVNSLDGFPDPTICGETFAATIGSSGAVWRRGFTATSWEQVLDFENSDCNVIRADPNSGFVWAGGSDSFGYPWVLRSTDQGDTWNGGGSDLPGTVNAIVVHPDDPDVAYAGFPGGVIETSNGGLTWSYTGLSEVVIRGLALDAGWPSHLLAGGNLGSHPNAWALWESFDDAETWQEVAAPALQPPGPVTGISSILANPTTPGTFYIATLGHGVWKYTRRVSDPGSLPLPQRVFLAQNHPNPFNPATTIRFDVSEALHGSRVHLAIYDPRGRLVRILVDREMGAGRHRAEWNGTDASGKPVVSGVYFGRLRVGSEVQVRKLSLVR